jgi:hypothetical protein
MSGEGNVFEREVPTTYQSLPLRQNKGLVGGVDKTGTWAVKPLHFGWLLDTCRTLPSYHTLCFEALSCKKGFETCDRKDECRSKDSGVFSRLHQRVKRRRQWRQNPFPVAPSNEESVSDREGTDFHSKQLGSPVTLCVTYEALSTFHSSEVEKRASWKWQSDSTVGFLGGQSCHPTSSLAGSWQALTARNTCDSSWLIRNHYKPFPSRNLIKTQISEKGLVVYQSRVTCLSLQSTVRHSPSAAIVFRRQLKRMHVDWEGKGIVEMSG